MMSYRNYIIVIVLLFASVGLAQDQATAPLVAGDLLRGAGLMQVWQTKLAVRGCELVERFFLLGDRVYALTSTNYLFAVDRNTGSLAFGAQVADEGFPVLEPQLYEKQLLVTAGNKLIQIDTSSGATTYTQKFDYTVVCPIVRNKENLYAVGINKHIQAMVMADKRYLFDTGPDNDSSPTSILADSGSVTFATDAGNIFSISAYKPELRWRYNALDKITSPLVRDNNDFYAAGRDTYLYRLNVSTGKLVWKCQLGGMLENSPRVAQIAVYQYVPDKGITAVDKQSGKILWTAEDGVDLLSETNGRAYLMTCGRTVAVIDNTTGKRLLTINFAKASLQAANTIDGKMYIADRLGRVACIAAAK